MQPFMRSDGSSLCLRKSAAGPYLNYFKNRFNNILISSLSLLSDFIPSGFSTNSVLLVRPIYPLPGNLVRFNAYNKQMRDLRFTRQWRFKPSSSGLWWCVVMRYYTSISEGISASLKMEARSSKVIRNDSILPQHYTALQTRRLRHESMKQTMSVWFLKALHHSAHSGKY